jgi:methyl-accepting chemotaxis protein
MTDIHASSARVAQITAVIDSMAFETNLLALNAAVEAARAGDHGRGFAVVASEVRALAQKSAEAAGTIRRIVDESAGRAERGTQRVDAAGKTMTEIVEQVGKVTALITQMSRGSDEQFASVERVNAAVRTLDAMTQRNSAVAEQSTVAARMLLDQAVGLADAVSAFRLERGDPGPRSAPPVGRGVPVVKEAIAA